MIAGTKVELAYTGTFEDGTVFGYAKPDEPLVFEIGEGMILDALENAVLQMENIGEKKRVVLQPFEAYGERIEDKSEKIPCSVIPPDQRVVGARAFMDTPEGSLMGVCVSVDDDVAVFDLNHPLAGKTLVFDLELLGWEEPQEAVEE